MAIHIISLKRVVGSILIAEEEARSLLRHFLATIADHRLSELEDGDILISFSSSLRSTFFE